MSDTKTDAKKENRKRKKKTSSDVQKKIVELVEGKERKIKRIYEIRFRKRGRKKCVHPK